jgi:hypothetical protein
MNIDVTTDIREVFNYGFGTDAPSAKLSSPSLILFDNFKNQESS